MTDKLPYFQYYPADFEQGTAAFTLIEVGAYQRLLNYQWSHGSVPGDNLKALAQILRCPPSMAKAVWAVIQEKFPRTVTGAYRNPRLAEVRRDAEALHDKNRANGAKGGRPPKPKDNPPVNPPVNPNGTQTKPKHNPTPNPNERQSESESESEEEHSENAAAFSSSSSRAAASPPPLLMSPLQYARLQERHAFIGSRLQIPNALHAELRTKIGGREADARLHAWYLALNDDLERTNTPYGDVWVWVRQQFKLFARDAATEAVRVAFMNATGGSRGQ